MSPSAQTPLRRFVPPTLALVASVALGVLDPGTDARALGGGLLLAFWFAAAGRLGTQAARARGGPRGRALLRAGLFAYFFIVVSMAALGLLQVLSIVTMTLTAAIAWVLCPPASLGKEARPMLAELSGRARRDPAVATLVLAATLISCLTVAWAFLCPPVRWDDLVYHLTYPVEWAQSGSLATRDILFGNHGPAWFPKTTELWITWLFLPLGELFHLTGAQAPFLVGLALAAYDVARRLGAATRSALVVTAFLVAAPGVQTNMAGGYVDVAFAFLFLVVVDALLALRDRPDRWAWLELMGAIGLFLGTKVQGLPVVVFVLGPLGAALLWERRPRRLDHRLATGLALGFLVALAGGGWWYVRNYILSGNPIFPLLTEVLGFELFDGAYDRSDLPSGDAGLALRLFDHNFAAPWRILTLAPFALGVYAALRNRQRRIAKAALLAVGVSFGLLLTIEHLVPFAYTRFALPVLAISVFALLPALEDSKLQRVLPWLALAALAVPFTRPSAAGYFVTPAQHLLEWSAPVILAFGLATLATLGVLVRSCVRFASIPKRTSRNVVLALGLGAACVGRLTSDPSRSDCFKPVAGVWAPSVFLEEQPPARIAMCGITASLPLHGIVPKHTVSNVWVNTPWGVSFAELVRGARPDRAAHRGDRNGIAYYRAEESEKLWNDNLDAFGADFLVCYPYPRWLLDEERLARNSEGFGSEFTWAESDPQRFQLVFSNGGCRIFKIVRP
jgi:hypothetical protein